jgi:hypothetical protein
MEALWPIITVVGPLLLIGVVIWATLRNRNAPPGTTERAERGAHELREEIKRDPNE